MLVELSQSQDIEAGDGTMSVCLSSKVVSKNSNGMMVHVTCFSYVLSAYSPSNDSFEIGKLALSRMSEQMLYDNVCVTGIKSYGKPRSWYPPLIHTPNPPPPSRRLFGYELAY